MSLSHEQPRTLFLAIIDDSNRFFAARVEEHSWRFIPEAQSFLWKGQEKNPRLPRRATSPFHRSEESWSWCKVLDFVVVQKINLESLLIVSQHVGRSYE